MKKILIIDNSQLIINVLQDLFALKNQYRVYIAKSLNEVEKMILSNEFFLAISNQVLPDTSNGELLYTLKSANLPTIILSSKIDDKTIAECHKFQVIDYFLKDSISGLKQVVHLAELLLFMKGRKVLLIEDSSVFANQLKVFLEALFLRVVVVDNGKTAFEYLENNNDISLMITDYDLPKPNGLQLIQRVKKIKNLSELPIIMISSDSSKNLKIKSYKYGLSDFLQKPILFEELKSKIINIYSNLEKIKRIKNYNKMFNDHVIASVTNHRGIIRWVSKAFCDISGYSKEELIGANHNIVRHPDMPSSIYKELWSTIQSGKTWKGEIKNIRKDGTHYWVSSTVDPEFNSDGEIIAYHSVRQDITDKKRIYELSITDGLTGLYNRRFFNNIAYEQLRHSSRVDSIFTFCILDVDNFKKYNDTYGHQKGDDVLISISKSLKNIFKRSDDCIFRLGGEEFGLILHTKSLNDVKIMIDKARCDIESLSIEHILNSPYNKCTCSFGLVSITSKKDLDFTIDNLYKLADDKLYESKQNGRNRIEFIEV